MATLTQRPKSKRAIRPKRALSPEKRVALINSLYGKYKGVVSSDDILRDRQEELERDEARYRESLGRGRRNGSK